MGRAQAGRLHVVRYAAGRRGFPVCWTCPGARHNIGYLEPKLTRDAQKPVILYTDPYATYQSMISVYDVLVVPEREDNLARDEGDR